jgi:hypothetical protein
MKSNIRGTPLGAVSASQTITSLVLLCSCLTAFGQYTTLTLPKGYVQVEGDIITTEDKAAQLLADRQGLQVRHPNFAFVPSRLWPNRVVPFEFDAGVTAPDRSVFLTAMKWWSNSFPGVVTINFRLRTTEPGFLRLVVANPGFVGGSTDYVGYSGGTVTITVHSNAVNAGLIAHELGHALGLWHEQSRNDRDAFVTVNYAVILSGDSSQFDKDSPQSTFGNYDYDSIMHYGACAFSVFTNSCECLDETRRTITTAFPEQQCKIGQRGRLSAMDKRSMAFMYGPPDWKFLHAKTGSSGDGSFQQPFQILAPAAALPPNSTLWLGAGTLPAAGVTISTPMTLRAAIPDLQLQADGSLGPSPSGYATLQ